ncbi:MAG: hypothetical protein ACREH9_12280 [Pseudomonadota bacterium]
MKPHTSPCLLAASLVLLVSAPSMLAQRGYERARRLVSRVDSDLKQCQRRETISAKEQERYNNALRDLSQFDRRLTEGTFDKGKLDASIDDVHNVVKNNTLSPRDRDMLTGDLTELRDLRAGGGR